jgi:hypothetical protein
MDWRISEQTPNQTKPNQTKPNQTKHNDRQRDPGDQTKEQCCAAENANVAEQ